MTKFTILSAVAVTVIISSCRNPKLNREEADQFREKCAEQAIASVGEDKIDMVMGNYKDKCTCLVKEVIKDEIPIEDAMKMLEDKYEVLAKLTDIECK